MPRLGNEDEGFEVELSEGATAIHVKAWGFWGPELAARLMPTVLEACRASQGVKALIIDARGLKPQRESGQLALGALMAALPGLGIVRSSVTTDSSLTRLQLLRIAKERAAKTLVQINAVTPM